MHLELEFRKIKAQRVVAGLAVIVLLACVSVWADLALAVATETDDQTQSSTEELTQADIIADETATEAENDATAQVSGSLPQSLSNDEPVVDATAGEQVDSDRDDKVAMIKSQVSGNWTYIAETSISGYTVIGAVWGTEDDHKAKGGGYGDAVRVTTQKFVDNAWSDPEVAQDDCDSGSFGTDPILVNFHGTIRLTLSTTANLGEVTMSVIQEKTTDKDVEITNADANQAKSGIRPLNGGLKPAVHSRYEWGADDNQMNLHDAWPSGDVGYCHDKAGIQPNVYRGVVIHHTAGSNNYSQAEVPGIIRSVFNYHASSLQWGDIGYNFLIDKYGGIWEGRYGSMNTTAVGYHALPHANCSTFGISVLGEYGSAPTTGPMIQSIVDVIAWKFNQYGINPRGNSTIGVENGWAWLPTIVGHRDVGRTACPGQNLYNQIPAIRSEVLGPNYQYNINSMTLYRDEDYTATIEPNDLHPDQEVYARILAQNTGTKSWNSNTKIGTYDPMDRTSMVEDSWQSRARPAKLNENSVSPLSTGTFEFKMHMPNSPGIYHEDFRLVQEGETWHSGPDIRFELHVVRDSITDEDIENSKVVISQAIYSSNSIISTKGINQAIMQTDGNFVVYEKGSNKVIWNSGTVGNPGARFVNQTDGNLVIYSPSGRAIWNSGTVGYGASILTIQNDGNLVAYTKSNSEPSWSSKTGRLRTAESFGCSYSVNCIKPGTGFNALDTISNTKGTRLIMQSDGNLVLYKSSGQAIWNSGTAGNPGAKFINQTDGNLVIYSSSGRVIWNSGTVGRMKTYIVLQNDNNLVAYNTTTNNAWNTGTVGKIDA